jgi:ABC-2 type transport system ATP-binding protein
MQAAPSDSLRPAVSCRGLRKVYDARGLAGRSARTAVVAVDGLDLAIRRGECFGLLGPNGAGKTTTVEILEGILEPSAGDGERLGMTWARDEVRLRERIGVALQETRLPERLSVSEVLDLFRSFYPRPRPVDALLSDVELTEKRAAWVGKLSGGQRQRLLFALAICGDPDFLVLDEPTVGLDVEARRGFWSEMRRLVSRGRSLLLTTHYIEEAEALADRIVILQGGRIIADGSPTEIKARVAGRHIRCVTTLSTGEVAMIPGVRGVRQDKEAMVVLAAEVEPVVRELLARDSSLAELEITRSNLEDAFLELTMAEPARPASLEAR